MAEFLQLPEDVRDLLAVVDSFEKLEVVCRMGTRPHEPWTMLEISDNLGLSPDVLEDPVRELVVAGLLERVEDGRLRFAARGDRADQAVVALMRLYQDDKLLIVRAITQMAFERIRSNAARTFADAFVFRRSKPEDPS